MTSFFSFIPVPIYKEEWSVEEETIHKKKTRGQINMLRHVHLGLSPWLGVIMEIYPTLHHLLLLGQGHINFSSKTCTQIYLDIGQNLLNN